MGRNARRLGGRPIRWIVRSHDNNDYLLTLAVLESEILASLIESDARLMKTLSMKGVKVLLDEENLEN